MYHKTDELSKVVFKVCNVIQFLERALVSHLFAFLWQYVGYDHDNKTPLWMSWEYNTLGRKGGFLFPNYVTSVKSSRALCIYQHPTQLYLYSHSQYATRYD